MYLLLSKAGTRQGKGCDEYLTSRVCDVQYVSGVQYVFSEAVWTSALSQTHTFNIAGHLGATLVNLNKYISSSIGISSSTPDTTQTGVEKIYAFPYLHLQIQRVTRVKAFPAQTYEQLSSQSGYHVLITV